MLNIDIIFMLKYNRIKLMLWASSLGRHKFYRRNHNEEDR